MKKQLKLTLCTIALCSSTVFAFASNITTTNENTDLQVLKPVVYPSLLKINHTATQKDSEQLSPDNNSSGTIVVEKEGQSKKEKNKKIKKEKIKTDEKVKTDENIKDKKNTDKNTKKDKSENKGEQEELVDASVENPVVLPIYTKNNSNQDIDSQVNAIYNGKSILIPIDYYRNVSPFTIRPNQYANKYIITLPGFRVAGDYIYNDVSSKKQDIRLPITMVDGKQYVDLVAMSEFSGVKVNIIPSKDLNLTPTFNNMATQSMPLTNKVISLTKSTGQIAAPQKISLQAPLNWVFDPLVDSDEYTKPFTNKNTSIISPSWFKLTNSGLEVSSKVTYDYVNSYEKNGYRVWPLVSNQFDANFTHGILVQENLWDKYVQQLAMYALLYHYDGYNFDFEDVDYSDKDRLTKFIAYLTQNLHNYGLYTSMDVTGYSDSPNWSMVYDRPNLANNLDYLVLMAYDETWASSPKAGPVASYPWVRKHVQLLTKEVNPNKIVLGVPFYMRKWTEKHVNGKTSVKSSTMSIIDSRQFKEDNSKDVVWNDELKLYYAEVGNNDSNTSNQNTQKEVIDKDFSVVDRTKSTPTIDETIENKTNEEKSKEVKTTEYKTSVKKTLNGDTIKVWFEDEKSMSYKINLIKEFQLAGFAAWRKGFEDSNMIKSISQDLKFKDTNKSEGKESNSNNKKKPKLQYQTEHSLNPQLY